MHPPPIASLTLPVEERPKQRPGAVSWCEVYSTSQQLGQQKQKEEKSSHTQYDVEQRCKQAGIINAEWQGCSGVDTLAT
jgi:hypothetical protein